MSFGSPARVNIWSRVNFAIIDDASIIAGSSAHIARKRSHAAGGLLLPGGTSCRHEHCESHRFQLKNEAYLAAMADFSSFSDISIYPVEVQSCFSIRSRASLRRESQGRS